MTQIDCNPYNPVTSPLSLSLTLTLKACHHVLAKHSVIALLCPGAGHVEKVVWVTKKKEEEEV